MTLSPRVCSFLSFLPNGWLFPNSYSLPPPPAKSYQNALIRVAYFRTRSRKIVEGKNVTIKRIVKNGVPIYWSGGRRKNEKIYD